MNFGTLPYWTSQCSDEEGQPISRPHFTERCDGLVVHLIVSIASVLRPLRNSYSGAEPFSAQQTLGQPSATVALPLVVDESTLDTRMNSDDVPVNS